MEDIATWREYLGATNAVSDAEPHYSDSELHGDQKGWSKSSSSNQRVLNSEHASSTSSHFSIYTLPTDPTPQPTNKPQARLKSDTKQHLRSLFSLSPDYECHW